MKWEGNQSVHMMRNACGILMGKLEEKRLLRRHRCKLEDRSDFKDRM
jgi:hypothetical protein